MYKQNWRGIWEFYITEGAPLSCKELKIAQKNGIIGREYEVKRYENVILKQWRERIVDMMAGGGQSIALNREQLGRDATAANENDTGLIDPEPLTLKQISSLRKMEAEGTPERLEIVSFWPEGTPGLADTWKEYGVGVLESGIFFALRVNIDITVAGQNSLTVRGEIHQNIA